jgi:hypothetical protein
MTHLITPPPELRSKWFNEAPKTDLYDYIIEQAAQWGADQELEACCALMDDWGLDEADLRAARRPKPPSLKEQALAALSEADQGLNKFEWQQRSNTIRRALEQLDD